jgi:hypothetical protein
MGSWQELRGRRVCHVCAGGATQVRGLVREEFIFDQAENPATAVSAIGRRSWPCAARIFVRQYRLTRRTASADLSFKFDGPRRCDHAPGGFRRRAICEIVYEARRKRSWELRFARQRDCLVPAPESADAASCSNARWPID